MTRVAGHCGGVALRAGVWRLARPLRRAVGAAAGAGTARTMPRCPSPPTTPTTNTRAQLARVNYLRDEPGGRRFFVNDLNGPLYILDKQTKAFTTYLDFNGPADGRACSRNSPSRGTSRPASPTSSSIRTTRRTACSTRFTWKTRRPRHPRRRRAASCRTRSVRIHHDAGGVDADRRRPDRSRGRARRVEGSQRRERARSKARRASCCACSIRWRRIRWAR